MYNLIHVNISCLDLTKLKQLSYCKIQNNLVTCKGWRGREKGDGGKLSLAPGNDPGDHKTLQQLHSNLDMEWLVYHYDTYTVIDSVDFISHYWQNVWGKRSHFLNFTFHVDAFISPYSNILSRIVHYHSQR